MTLQRGQFIKIRYQGDEAHGMVMLASSNGKSLMLGFHGMLGGFVSAMPVLQDEAGIYRDLVDGKEVQILLAKPESH